MVSDMRGQKNDLARCLCGINNHPLISQHNKSLIMRYGQELTAHGMSPRRIIRKSYDLKGICVRWLPAGKNLDALDMDDIKSIIAQIETSDYAEYTKSGFKITLKSFVCWVRGSCPGHLPPEVAWFRTSVKRQKQKLPEDMLTEEEIERMINAESHPRQRALIAILYETGCRIGELLSIRLKHVAFDEHGSLVLVHGKTGYRRVRIIASVPYLLDWLNNHPNHDDPDAVLWTKLKSGEAAGYAVIRKMLTITARRAGIKKKVNPHNFRHSRATHLANHLTEAQMKQYLGWVQGSNMAAIYVHLSSRDVDNALLRLYGINKETTTNESRLKPVTCTRCQELNGFANKMCRRCGALLKPEEKHVVEHIERGKSDAILDKMLEDPEFKKIFTQKARDVMSASQ